MGANGLTEAVLAEIELALDHHELIKIKVASEDRETIELVIDAIGGESKGEKGRTIGRVVVMFRESEARKIEIPLK